MLTRQFGRGIGGRHPALLGRRFNSKKVLFIGTVWPEFSSSAAGVRSVCLVNILADRGWDVSYFSPARFKQNSTTLRAKTFSCPIGSEQFMTILADVSPNLVIYDRFVAEGESILMFLTYLFSSEQFGWQVRAHDPKITQVLDTQDLHFLRRARESAIAAGKSIQEVINISIPQDDRNFLRFVIFNLLLVLSLGLEN